MEEEMINNQNAWTDVQESPMSMAFKSISNFRNQTQQRSNQQVISDLMNSSNTMYWQAMTRRNSATSKEELKASQLDAFAALVKWRAIEDWYSKEWESYNTTPDIVKHYMELNNSKAVNQRLVQYSESNQDPYEFWVEMWLILSPQEQKLKNRQKELEMIFWEWVPNWLVNTYSKLLSTVEWLSAWTDPIQRAQWNDIWATETGWNDEAPIVAAIENYAMNNFGKHVTQLNEYESQKILSELTNEEELKKYLPTWLTAFTNAAEWIWYGLLQNVYPMANLWFTAFSQIPVVWEISAEILSKYATMMWQALTYTIWAPILWPISYNLSNEEDRLAWYEFIWGMFMWWAHETGNGNKWNKKIKSEFTKFISGSDDGGWPTLWLQKESNGWLLWAFEKWKLERQNAKEGKIREKMTDEASKVIEPDFEWQNQQTADALSQIPSEKLKWIKSSKELYEALEEIGKSHENAENMILNTIEQMYWLDTSYEKPISVEQWGKEYTSNKPRQYIREWINLMKEMAEFQEEQQYIDIAEQIAQDWNLTPYNVAEMARALSKQFDLYSERATWPELQKTKTKIEAVRQWLKNILRDELDRVPEWRELWVNPLKYFDEQWSSIIATKSNVMKLRNAWNKVKSRIPDKNVLNHLWTIIDKIPLTKAKAVRTAIEWIKWEDLMSLLSKEKNINKALKAFAELRDKLPKDPTKEQIDSIMKDWMEKHPWIMEEYGSVLEWEVIEPEEYKWKKGRNPYLEEMFDKVDIVDPNLYLEWNPAYNWEPTVTINVDENGYPQRAWQTRESYKWKKKWEWTTPKSWNEMVEAYASRFGQTGEWWKKQLEAAWVPSELIDVFMEKIAKKNFKTRPEQPSLFSDLE